jgi:malto-oligosyltrehalose trehalohydrolase
VTQSLSPLVSFDLGKIDGWPAGVEALAEAALPDFLLRQRWYPAKDADRPEVRLAALAPLRAPGIHAAVAVWRVTPPGQSPLCLFVPLALVSATSGDDAELIAAVPANNDGAMVAIVEATSQDEFVRAWIGLLLGGAAADAQFRAEHTKHLAQADLSGAGDWSIRRGSVEQSNTSIRIGERAILKVIRKVETGIHPELEICRFLSDEDDFAATPKLLGWMELAGDTEKDACTLSILQAFAPNQGDGWSWMLQRLGEGAEGYDLALDEATAWLQRLGTRTAEMHKAFARESKDPAFAPQAVTADDVGRWGAAAQALARRALDGLALHRGRLSPAAQGIADSLIARRERIAAKLDRLLPQPGCFMQTRHHGDFHLGQVLVTGGDAAIIDFEGEPMRPLAERRAKHAPLRDVAGLLRSLSYATAAAGRDLPDGAPDAALGRLAAWEEKASQAFFNAYLAAAEDTASLPAEAGECKRTVRFFMLEKAFYEIAYELANRPEWVEVPLRGVLGLIGEGDLQSRAHAMPFGAELRADGAVRFRLWAPRHAEIGVEIGAVSEPVRMDDCGEGWHELITDRAHAGSPYRFVLPDGVRVPDPASRFQPDDVHGPSEVWDPQAYRWSDGRWRGRPWREAVIYELHIGAFTPQGTFRGAIEKLDHLAGLGVTAIEIMPIGDFPGRRNWGYDGVLPYAPDASYGRPDDLKALVDAAHARGLMVLLDVVYNHFGPEGSYLQAISPIFFTDRYKTPWGGAINVDGEDSGPVREFLIHNALYWIEEFHLDGLRLDAVHAIVDASPIHLLEELAECVRRGVPDRHVHLVLENEENQASRLSRDTAGEPRWYTAQWNDDAHHALHVTATGEASGYYADYLDQGERLGRALAEGFAFQGEVMPYRGTARGEPSAGLPPTAFVAFVQNHDQIGNRAFGDRLSAIAAPEAVRAVGAVYLLLPQIPMLFMGEEWAAAQPFPFFCDFSPELAEAVRTGRRDEFARFLEFQSPEIRERIPDPTAEETFLVAKLGWADIDREPHVAWLERYRRILAVRHREIVPRLDEIDTGGTYRVLGKAAVVVRWRLVGDTELMLAANLCDSPTPGFSSSSGRVIWREGEASDDGIFGPFAVRWSIGEKEPEHHV